MMQHTTQGSSRLFQRSSLIIGAVLISLGLALCSFVPSAHAVTAAEKQAEVEEALSHIVIHGNRTDEDIQRMGYVKPQ